jgi:hypothetical protein
VVATAADPNRQRLLTADGNQGSVEAIADADYVFDADGNQIGAYPVAVAVELAVRTVQGSAAVQRFGTGPFPKTVGGSTENEIKASITAALNHLTEAGRAEIVSVSFTRFGKNAGQVDLVWRDLTRSTLSTLRI